MRLSEEAAQTLISIPPAKWNDADRQVYHIIDEALANALREQRQSIEGWLRGLGYASLADEVANDTWER